MARSENTGGEDKWQELGKQVLEWLHLPPLMIHVGLVLVAGWIASLWNFNFFFFITLGMTYLCYIERRQKRKIEATIRADERRSTDRKRLLSEAETARWLNSVVESAWPIFMEKFASEQFLMRLAPWFLDKYKPWTAEKVVLQHIRMGKTPPVLTFFRAGRHPTDGDHLVLETTMNFSAASDMNASMAVKMRKLGIWASINITNLQVEGKLKLGIKFVKGWPVIKRLRICFSEAPFIKMVAKPVFRHGMDVTDLPGIAAWLDKMIEEALEQSLVEPNLLVVDVEKLVGDLMSVHAKLQANKPLKPEGDWCYAGKQRSVATLLVEIIEGARLKPCDPNGKADPYVKIILGKTQFTTSIKKKTLNPSWLEEFRIPIISWDAPNLLILRVRDKDHFSDDEMGHKQISIDEIRDGQRHALHLNLDGVKTGLLNVALTVEETPTVDGKLDNSFDNAQCEDARSVPIISSAEALAESIREAQDSTRPVDDCEALGPDFDGCPMRDESENVDVGVGQPGSVSILSPGKHVVNDVYGNELLRRSKKSWKGSWKDRDSNKSARQGEELDNVQGDSPVQESKRSRIRNLLGRTVRGDSKKDLNGEDVSRALLQEEGKLIAVGNKGTEVHMKLAVD